MEIFANYGGKLCFFQFNKVTPLITPFQSSSKKEGIPPDFASQYTDIP